MTSQEPLALTTAADSCEGTVERLCLNTSVCCDGVTSAVTVTIGCVLEAKGGVNAKVKRLCSSRDKRLVWQCEEFDACKAMLEGLERQLCAAPEDVELSEAAVRQLLIEVNDLPTHSSVVLFTSSTMPELVEMSHVQLGVDSGRSSVSCAELLARSEGNVVTICCRDVHGTAVRALTLEDVSVRLSEDGVGWTVRETTVHDGSVSVCVTISAEAPRTMTLVVDIHSARIEAPLQVRKVLIVQCVTWPHICCV